MYIKCLHITYLDTYTYTLEFIFLKFTGSSCSISTLVPLYFICFRIYFVSL